MKDKENGGKIDSRIFIGGLSWDVTERQLEDTFDRFGKITECQIMVGKDTGRPRGFGFITFSDRRGADDAIKHMHGRELGDKVISVNKAEPKVGGDDVEPSHKGGGYSSREKGSYGKGTEDKCFKCGRLGHWARECPSAGGDRGRFRDPLPVRSRIGEFDGHQDRYGDRELERDRDRYMDGHRVPDGGRYSYRDRFEGGDKYDTRDHYPMERYGAHGDRLVCDRYGIPEHHLENEYRRRERSFDRDRYAMDASDRYMDRYARDASDRYRDRYARDASDRDRYARDASDRYGTTRPIHDEGRAYRSRPGPYDRPSRAGSRPSSYERW